MPTSPGPVAYRAACSLESWYHVLDFAAWRINWHLSYPSSPKAECKIRKDDDSAGFSLAGIGWGKVKASGTGASYLFSQPDLTRRQDICSSPSSELSSPDFGGCYLEAASLLLTFHPYCVSVVLGGSLGLVSSDAQITPIQSPEGFSILTPWS